MIELFAISMIFAFGTIFACWMTIRSFRSYATTLEDELKAHLSIRTRLQSQNDELIEELHLVSAKRYALADQLKAIADQEKPTSNATVKRMARMAREALK